MFRLQRQTQLHKSSKSLERIDFKFSNFQALQVPKGWDRLFLSIISADSGKTIAKLGKALVQNGICRWTETLSESIWVSKESEEHLFKFVISMGSSRAGILGEATIDMSSYTSSKMSSPVTLPLRKCSYGTTLQVKIQCLAPKPNIRPGSPKHSSGQENGERIDYHDIDADITNEPDNLLVRGSKTSSNKALDVNSHHGDHNDKEHGYSVSGSKLTFNLSENSRKAEKVLSGNGYSIHQSHSRPGSKTDLVLDNYPVDDCSFSSQSSSNSSSRNSRSDLQTGRKDSGLEAAENTIEELRAEAKMWERNARKLMIDKDSLRSDILDQSKKQADLVMELSEAYAEQDGLKKEVEQLKQTLEDLNQKLKNLEGSAFQNDGRTQIQKELESEIRYHQQTNANLSQQLQRSQESNIELVSILQELEETIEQQKVEIENLSALPSKHTDIDSSAELQRLQESEKQLSEKIDELENEWRLNSQSLSAVEKDYKDQLRVRDEDIAKLEAKVQQSTAQSGGSESDLIKEIETLREKVQELERDCNELTEENLELLLRIKDSKNHSIEKCDSFSSASSELPTKSYVSDTEPQICDLELKEVEQWATFEASELFSELLQQLVMAVRHLMKLGSNVPPDFSKKCDVLLQNLGNAEKVSANSRILAEYILKYFLELNSLLGERIAEYERTYNNNETEIHKRDEIIAEAHKNLEVLDLEVQQHESSRAELEAVCQNLQKELSHEQSAKEFLDRRSEELENEKQIVESTVIQLQEEILSLQGEVSVMDGQMRRLADENDSSRLKVKNLEAEMESNHGNLNQKIHVMQAQLSEGLTQREYLSSENQGLKASCLKLTEERDTLHEQCEQMTVRFAKVEQAFSVGSRKVEAVEENLNLVLEDFSSKEKSLKSELDDLLQEYRKDREKFGRQEVSANQIHMETLAEIENLKEEVESLTKQIDALHMEKERIESEAAREISSLRADKENLETALMEVQSRLEISKNELVSMAAKEERSMKLVATYRATEDKLKTDVSNLELKLTVLEYKNQQLREDGASKKLHLQSIGDLQNEVEECRLEKEKLEASVLAITADYESLKAEKLSCDERLSSLQDAMTEYESYKQKTISLQEKLIVVESDLAAKEVLYAKRAHLENELNEVREANKQYQLKLYQLEEEKAEWLQKARALEMNLGNEHDLGRKGSNSYVVEDANVADDEAAETFEVDKRHKTHPQGFSSEEQSSDTIDHTLVRETFERTKSSLETELRDLQERYLQMSLKYAEVEAEREDLVMKLKSAKNGKRWF